MAKFLVVMQWFGQDEPEVEVVEGETEEEVYEEFEHNMNSVTVVPLDKVLEAIKAEVDEGEFAVLLDERLIKALKKAYKDNGYNLPETECGWSDIINDLLEEKIAEDFGREYLE